MANRKTPFLKLLPTAVALAAMLSSSNLAALGLGALEIRSNLDQPLDGTIELRVADGDDISQLDAKIASREDFEALGIDYPSYLEDVQLTMENRNSQYVLRVESNDVIIKEPFIHFLVRVDWSGGSFLREYTALIDPPLYASEAPVSVSQPKIVGVDERFQPEPQRDISVEDLDNDVLVDEVYNDESSYDEVVVDDDVSSSDIGSDSTYQDPSSNQVDYGDTENTDAQYGPVVSGESLSLIAAELQRQFPDLSIYQIMKVLFEENRNAFIDDNINGLKRGEVLRIGDLSAIRAVDVEEGRQFFQAQLSEWDPSVLETNSFVQDDGLSVGQDEYGYDDILGDYASSDTSSSSTTTTTDSFQVGASTDTQANVSNGDSQAGEVLALQQQIAELESSLSSRSLENQELTERISLLEGQLADMNRLMSLNVEDADLANLESTLAAQNNADDAIGDEASFDGSLPADGSLSAEGSLPAEGSSLADGSSLAEGSLPAEGSNIVPLDQDTAVSGDDGFIDPLATGNEASTDNSSQVVTAAETSTPAVAAPQRTPARQQGFFEKATSAVTDSGLGRILAGLGVLLAGGLGVWYYRRRRADEEYEISMLSIETQSLTINEPIPTRSQSVTRNEPTADRETSFLTVYSDSDAVVQADEVDPIAEADVYIAYGRDEQAEEVLLDGIASRPNRVDIKRKLLGLYHKNNNVEGFERIAEELYSQKSQLTKEVWQEVSLMGKNLAPNNPLFDLSTADLLGDQSDIDAASEVSVNMQGDAEQTMSEMSLLQESTISVHETESEDEIEMALAEGDNSINLINFDDGRSEISELDEIAIDDLDLDDDDDDDAEVDDSAETQQERADNVVDLVSELNIDDDDEQGGEAIEFERIDVPEPQPNKGSLDSEISDLEIDGDYDESRTQFELAKVFVDLGDEDGARKILNDIVANDDTSQDVLDEASELLANING